MKSFLKTLWCAAVDFRRHGCGSLAASLAFFFLVSFFPMVFLLLYGVSFVLSHEQVGHEFLVSFFQGFMPNLGPELSEEIKRISQEEVVRLVVFLTFAWFGLLVFIEVEYAVNVVFESPHKRHPLISTALSIALIGLVALLFILSYLVTQILSILISSAPRLGNLDKVALGVHHFLLSYTMPFLLLLLGVTCLYRYLPHHRPAWREALAGGLVLAVLWELTKHLFTNYIQTLAVYGRMYGSLLVVVLFLLWVYYSAVLFLYGAEVVHRLQLKSHPAASP